MTVTFSGRFPKTLCNNAILKYQFENYPYTLSESQISAVFILLDPKTKAKISKQTYVPTSLISAQKTLIAWSQENNYTNIFEMLIHQNQVAFQRKAKHLLTLSRWDTLSNFFSSVHTDSSFSVEPYVHKPIFKQCLLDTNSGELIFNTLYQAEGWRALTFFLFFYAYYAEHPSQKQRLKNWFLKWGKQAKHFSKWTLYITTCQLKDYGRWKAQHVKNILHSVLVLYNNTHNPEQKYHLLRQIYLYRDSQVQKVMWQAYRQENEKLKWLAAIGLAQQGQKEPYAYLTACPEKLKGKDGLDALMGINKKQEATKIAWEMLRLPGKNPWEPNNQPEEMWWDALNAIQWHNLNRHSDEIESIYKKRPECRTRINMLISETWGGPYPDRAGSPFPKQNHFSPFPAPTDFTGSTAGKNNGNCSIVNVWPIPTGIRALDSITSKRYSTMRYLCHLNVTNSKTGKTQC